ncbi:MAG: hypothetical protein JWL60_108 [Gemmatimonadetes bacterium]|nr:hypothetical protein [Gemmatimonadota bacterium]
MAKKPNYDFEKRKKEMDRKKKKDAKREDRLARKRDGAPELDEYGNPLPPEEDDADADPADAVDERA